MKKVILLGVIGGIVVVIITIWALIAGAGFLWKQFPEWTKGGETIVREAIKKAEDAFTAIKERAKEISPEMTEKVKEISPFDRIPEKDVAGEDIKPVPRYPGMIRVSYAITDQKRTVVYKGKVKFMAAIDFYHKEMATLGFKKKVIIASLENEVYEYRRGRHGLEFNFKKVATIPSEITELTIKEM